MSAADERPLEGRRIGVTASRKAAEQIALLERHGAAVTWAPVLAVEQHADDDELRAATEAVLSAPIDLVLATTGIGLRVWFAAAKRWGVLDDLLAALGRAEIVARGPKTVGALRAHGLRESWMPASESFDDVMSHVRVRDLSGLRVVLQEYGEPLPDAIATLRGDGADVVVVSSYRVDASSEPAAVGQIITELVEGTLDAVTFTSAMGVAAFIRAVEAAGCRDAAVAALRERTIAACVGHVTAAAFDAWDVPTLAPDRARTAAMVSALEAALQARD